MKDAPHVLDRDRRLLLETRRDIASTDLLVQQCPLVAFHAALRFTRDRLGEARVQFLDALADFARESDETADARRDVQTAAEDAADVWRWLVGKLRDRLLNPPPGARLTPDEMLRRERLVDRLFPVSPSGFRGATNDQQRQWLKAAIRGLSDPLVCAPLGDLSGLKAVDRLEAALADVRAVRETLDRESGEDRSATERFEHARAHLDDAVKLHGMQVEATLRAWGRLDALGDFLYARDPAYRVRQMTGKGLTLEPGMADIDAEVRLALAG
ncbi:MAG: hypothetical protein KC613_21535 [Myxococcales bacterium]|nr:hypothetical protein [Myxococcales bacterium]